MAELDTNGNSARWKRIRKWVLRRDGWTCQLCGAYPANVVGHIHPRSSGGTDDEWNLRVECKRCSLAGSAAIVAARWRNREADDHQQPAVNPAWTAPPPVRVPDEPMIF